MNWGILSTGVIAKNFAETAKKMDDVHIHAVASRSMESANAFADQYGIAVRLAVESIRDYPKPSPWR